MKNRKFSPKTFIAFVVIAIVLVISFVYGGNAPGYKYIEKTKDESLRTVSTCDQKEMQTAKKYIAGNSLGKKAAEEEEINRKEEKTKDNKESELKEDKEIIEKNITENTPDKDKKETTEKETTEKELTEREVNNEQTVNESIAVTEDEPEIIEEKMHPEEQPNDNICYISVVCDTIISNLEFFNKDKLDILPDRGIILPETKVEFVPGESVFSVTHKVLKSNKIHFEFTDNPMYSSVYVEGISNIYEFDCGDLSGWMYCVNGDFPNYGCSGYKVKPGDRIEWKYTCDLGEDVGSRFSNQR
ncbi:MAG: DUF4430 domain-containing protein [Ruminococcaceae bacterium]|nr:DUF4430 domain-containing protein [Oscillospiraceae bacterium]